MLKYIERIGVELEGGWDEDPGTTVHGDGSVECGGDFEGEVHSSPTNNLERLVAWVGDKYPDYVDSSCGLHVHVSFKNLDYYRKLMDEDFYSYFRERIEAWAEVNCPTDYIFWDRFNNENEFCRDHFAPEEQVFKYSSRYTQVNFCAYNDHGTIEFRLLPMFESSRISGLAITEVANIVESYLAKFKNKRHIRASITIPGWVANNVEFKEDVVCV